MSIHYVKPELSGLFAIDYQVEGGIKAKVRVDFYRLDATRGKARSGSGVAWDVSISGPSGCARRSL